MFSCVLVGMCGCCVFNEVKMYPQKPPSSYNQPQHQLQGGEQLTLRMIELAPFGNSSLKRETMDAMF